MARRPYIKPPISYTQQLKLLEKRNLTISNQAEAEAYLKEISYYRLSAYFLPYQRVKDNFNPDVTFKQIIKTYSFDRELRLLVFDCIERIEVAIRTQFIYSMAHYYDDAHWQDKKEHFVTPYYSRANNLIDPYNTLQGIINKAKTARRPEVFIKHYIDTYDRPANPPSWMCLELLTMGELSFLYKGLAKNKDKVRIASFFEVHPKVFISWLHSLTYVRNLCAHHSRLWNRDLAIEPMNLRKPVGPWLKKEFQNNKRVFYFICVLKYLLLRANPQNSLKDKLVALFAKYPEVPIRYLGIPSDKDGTMLDWAKEDLWK
jgi:abortive infection bacteriophage resistance protein